MCPTQKTFLKILTRCVSWLRPSGWVLREAKPEVPDGGPGVRDPEEAGDGPSVPGESPAGPAELPVPCGHRHGRNILTHRGTETTDT